MIGSDAEELSRALAQQEIVPYFQPLVELCTNRIVGFEILARWLRKGRPLVRPAHFIPLAERSGLIRALSESLLHQACVAAAKWPPTVCLSVNLPPSLMHEAALPDRLENIAGGTGFPIDRLSLEITEATAMADFEVARPIFEAVKALGARIALDDFGTGYSGLRRLLMLRFDALKIDRSFIHALVSQREGRDIVAAIIHLCRDLGLTSVAEGIERQDQADLLREMGCEIGQGWLFGRPMPMTKVASFLAARS